MAHPLSSAGGSACGPALLDVGWTEAREDPPHEPGPGEPKQVNRLAEDFGREFDLMGDAAEGQDTGEHERVTVEVLDVGGDEGVIEQMAQRGKISPSDLKLIFATDSVEEAIAHIRAKAIERFGLKRVAHMRRHFPWLGERGFPGKGPDIC